MDYIAVMDYMTIDMILSGKKYIESRFSKNQIIPYNTVKDGDVVYLKEPGKDISACFTVKKVLFFDHLNPDRVKEIRDKYDNLIKGPDRYWQIKQSSKYGTLMYIENPRVIGPIKISKKNRQGFVRAGGYLNGIN